ncbi:MAG: putative metal-binding motif-containing protein, partial [Deltaproteobacteria bacterium]|nr:putative metal-binding motif-containing protein [Deltaproteobacteria bacterium]
MKHIIGLALVLMIASACGEPRNDGFDRDAEDIVPTDSSFEGDVAATDPEDEDVPSGPCESDGDCEDGDPCTMDVCDTDYGICLHEDADRDGDGFVAEQVDGTDCGGTDCNDVDDEIFPGSIAVDCDGDMNCDGTDDDVEDRDGDGFVTDLCPGGDDCDDQDDRAFPGSRAVDCSDDDHDCNGNADEDNDGDGYVRYDDCYGDDCDDEDPDVNPGETELTCDGKDTDCDGLMAVEEDFDGDGYANEACVAPGEEVDCDDVDDNIHPGAVEVCDMIDQDCDGTWADAGADTDRDGGLDWRCGGNDCNDEDVTIYFGADEVCVDGIDQDCDGIVDGPIRMPAKTFVTDAQAWTYNTSMVWAGSQWGIAWEDSRVVFYDIRFARLDADGALVGTELTVTDTVTSTSRDPALSWTGSEFVVAWRDNRVNYDDIFAARISETGALSSTETQITGGTDYCRAPDLAWTGSELGLVWHDDRHGSYEIYFQRLDPDLTEVGSEVRVTDAPSYYSWYPAIAWSGSHYGLAWRDYRDGNHDVFFTTLDPDGTKVVTDTAMTTSVGWAHTPDIVWAASKWAVSWQDDRHSWQWEVYLAFMDTAGIKIGSDVRVTNDTAESEVPQLAWSGSEFAIHWADNRATDWHSYAVLLDADGVKKGSDIQLTL